MGADHRSDIDSDHHDRDTNNTPSLPKAPPSTDPGDIHENLPETASDDPVWCYDQPANNKRGKRRRYHGYVKRVGGTEGERIRRELAATIYDLLVWAKQQQETDTTPMDSGEEGGSR